MTVEPTIPITHIKAILEAELSQWRAREQELSGTHDAESACYVLGAQRALKDAMKVLSIEEGHGKA